MMISNFIEGWKKCRDILNKKVITDLYIDYNTQRMNVTCFDEDIVREMFEELCSESPNKVEIDAGSIKELYYKKLRNISAGKQYVEKECSKGLCRKGIVETEKFLNGRLYDYAWRCTCELGYNISKEIPLYTEQRAMELGHKLCKI